ncbi:MAG: di-heme oxidoredictase family protein [Alcaligenaceae bacterium]|nr:di-heme oxidoredictase family protein [Alcaligenaceae bacterium]
MLHKYKKIMLSTVMILTGVAFAQGQDDVTVDVLKPVVNRAVMEKQPSRWFEASEQTNTFPFKRAVDGMSYDEQDAFVIGRSFFTIPWVAAPSATTARDGLGPLFSANTCVTCHGARDFGKMQDEQGHVNRALTFKLVDLSKPYVFGEVNKPQYVDPVYGGQISVNGNSNASFEATPKLSFEVVEEVLKDGTVVLLNKPIPRLENLNYGPLGKDTHISLRMSPMLAGLGLIEALSDEQIKANEDPEDLNHDGISGRASQVIHPATGEKLVGRFGLKAQAANLAMQSADAANFDMGLINHVFPVENCTESQKACLAAPKGRPSPEGLLDLPDLRLHGIAFYVGHLKAPKPLPKDQYIQGRQIFKALNCVGCHKENWTTSTGIEFSPFSDFLVHDMGEGLADKRYEYNVAGEEWRTSPLWGLGAKRRAGLNLLHDGRASSVLEAILWHGGEAQQAKEAFKGLSKEQREAFIEFLENL